MERERSFTCTISDAVLQEWEKFVYMKKYQAAATDEKVTGKLLVRRALEEFMKKHPVKRKGN